ncbi:MAG: ribosomal RNA small subunit methyltransferase A [Caldilineaceae bacterium]|nr:ribosomal RNA small subunit methyltransferase A [Caldilineaceae bacterium]
MNERGMTENVMERVRRYQIDPKKSLGQNFLIDAGYLDRIVAAADLTPTDTVLEIGPGVGTLTSRLAAQAGHVVAVELDDRLIALLRADFASQPHVQIVHADILEVDPAALLAAHVQEGSAAGSLAREYKVVANLPYYITSLVLRQLLEATRPPALAVLMVQKEVAERICATPGDLSLLAVSVQFYAVPRIVLRVPAGAFYPAPKVDSAVLRLEVRPEPAVTGVSPKAFFRVVRAGFGQKRKQLANSLSAGLALPKSVVQHALESAAIDPKRRAETLSLPEWGTLSRLLATD